MASPAGVGATVSDAIGNTYFGERELIKLAFDDAGQTVQESALPTAPSPLGTARVLGVMPGLAVPNLLPASAVNAGKNLQVRAIDVIGALSAGTPVGVYALTGKAGDLLSVEVLSASLRRFANSIDSVVTVYDATGHVLNYYGQPAVNDDGLDSTDSVLFDILLPADGTYYIAVSA